LADLTRYVHLFSKLRRDQAKGWPSETRGKSPYKPLLLLSVIDEFEHASLSANLVELSPELGHLFASYCTTVLGAEAVCNIAMPFFALKNEGFWHLVPIPGKESYVESGRRLITEGQLANNVLGARLDDDLFALLAVKENRNVLRAALIDTYFDELMQPILWERVAKNQAAYLYSNELLAQARRQLKETMPLVDDPFSREVRDQGFRRAVVMAYNHRCACCGLRITIPGGSTAVEAAHIIPWKETHNDSPTNGLALCPLCHWSFDTGLMTVDSDYRVILSQLVSGQGNMPGFLSTLADRPIFLPSEQALYPEPSYLSWRSTQIFRRV
jgi:putative restriction endonuclease